MHARLSGGFAPAPMLSGGWYPVLARDERRITVSVDGAQYAVHESFLELREGERPSAVWSFDPWVGAGDIADLMPTAVCPAGHHITGIGPSRPTCRCDRCGRDYEIET